MKKYSDVTLLMDGGKLPFTISWFKKKGKSETEKKAYLLGIENAFSIFNQLMTEGINKESIMFYNSDVEVETEFTLYGLLDWLEKK
jgi:hypothetical protein